MMDDFDADADKGKKLGKHRKNFSEPKQPLKGSLLQQKNADTAAVKTTLNKPLGFSTWKG